MGVKAGGAVRADDPQVLETVVVANAIDMIEDEANLAPVPPLALTAQLAPALLQPSLIQSPFQARAAVGRPNYEDLIKRNPLISPAFTGGGIRIEMIDRYREFGNSLL